MIDGSILFGSNRYGIFRCVFPHDSRPLRKENVSRPKSGPFCRPGRGKGGPGDPHGRLTLRSPGFVGDDSVLTAAFRIPLCKYPCQHNKNRPDGRFLLCGGESGIPFLRKSHGGCGVPPAPRQEPPFESHSTNIHTYITKTAQTGGFCYVAERVGFEPTDARASPVFKTGAFNHSTISPNGRGLLYHRPRRRSILYQSTCSLPESSFTSTRQTSTWGYWAI